MATPRDPFPLAWPEGWIRTKSFTRTSSRFARGYGLARDAVRYEIARIRGANIIVTSNLPLNNKGTPDGRAEASRLADPGVAVWWMQSGNVERVMACDRWLTPGENLKSIAKSLESLRGITRWGASQVVDRAFEGFRALPTGSAPVEKIDWWVTLEIDKELFELESEDLGAIINSRYRKLAKIAHPDHGGSTEQMMLINEAFDDAKNYLAVTTVKE